MENKKSLKKDVLINIRGIQTADGESDVTELFTQGLLYRRRDSYYITYEESETTGFAGCRTTVRVDGPDRVSLIRHGPARTSLTVERGVRNIGFYGTQQGELLIGVSGSQVDVALDDTGGTLYFRYSLDVNSSLISENEVYVDVRENTALS